MPPLAALRPRKGQRRHEGERGERGASVAAPPSTQCRRHSTSDHPRRRRRDSRRSLSATAALVARPKPTPRSHLPTGASAVVPSGAPANGLGAQGQRSQRSADGCRDTRAPPPGVAMRVPSIPLAPALLIRASLAVPRGHRLGAGVSGMAGARSRQRRQLQRKGATHSCVHERQQAHARRRRTGGVPAGDHTQRRTPPIRTATVLSTALDWHRGRGTQLPLRRRRVEFVPRSRQRLSGHGKAFCCARPSCWHALAAATRACRGPIGDSAFASCTWLRAVGNAEPRWAP
jgi:hypothetical protein